jgi:hypothetical protein
MKLAQSHLGTTVLYVAARGEIVPGIITAIHSDTRVNLALVRDGVNHAHIDPHVYDVEYAPPHPVDGLQPLCWFTRAHL